jgi:hypothetical protein
LVSLVHRTCAVARRIIVMLNLAMSCQLDNALYLGLEIMQLCASYLLQETAPSKNWDTAGVDKYYGLSV